MSLHNFHNINHLNYVVNSQRDRLRIRLLINRFFNGEVKRESDSWNDFLKQKEFVDNIKIRKNMDERIIHKVESLKRLFETTFHEEKESFKYNERIFNLNLNTSLIYLEKIGVISIEDYKKLICSLSKSSNFMYMFLSEYKAEDHMDLFLIAAKMTVDEYFKNKEIVEINDEGDTYKQKECYRNIYKLEGVKYLLRLSNNENLLLDFFKENNVDLSFITNNTFEFKYYSTFMLEERTIKTNWNKFVSVLEKDCNMNLSAKSFCEKRMLASGEVNFHINKENYIILCGNNRIQETEYKKVNTSMYGQAEVLFIEKDFYTKDLLSLKMIMKRYRKKDYKQKENKESIEITVKPYLADIVEAYLSNLEIDKEKVDIEKFIREVDLNLLMSENSNLKEVKKKKI